jgi:chromosome partitioning protein
MRSIALLSRKGGSGKTTLSLHLAVLAQAEGERVLLVDADPQRSAAGWWRSRQADTPQLVEAEDGQLRTILDAAGEAGITLTVIDTAPHAVRASAEAATAADLVLIPCRPGILDLRAIAGTVEIVRAAHSSPAAVVLNACPPGREGEIGLTREAREQLGVYGVPVCPIAVSQRAAFAHALIDGRAVTEFDPYSRAAEEITALWSWLKERVPHGEARNIEARGPNGEEGHRARG